VRAPRIGTVDVCLVAGFGLAVAGVYLLAGLGVTLLVAGGVLFLAGGFAAAREGK